MHLKTLTLRGFKSFAGATQMRLEPGITCVVGPNGSGKSNVVDALAWVMGEQGAKTLRGGNMADVIFAGTSTRPALGRAQVELTIDNSDALLPIDYSEVTISRTLFRGGGSEYSINGAPARLLDIQELLSDTGMGRQMHVIVGQGQLDAILSSSPEERRAFIEEAAGVLKHRRRKERALRKLADMDANLVRVLDLTNEIHRQLGPLARQARAARRAHLVQAAIRDARARILAEDVVAARERLAAQGSDEKARLAHQEALEAQVGVARVEVAELREAGNALAPLEDKAGLEWQRATTLHERLAGTLLAAMERVKVHSRAEAPPNGDDPEELEERARAAQDEDAEVLLLVEGQRSALDEAVRAKERAEADDEAASRELARVNRVLADHREKVARLTGGVATAASRLEAARNESERAARALTDAQARQQQAESALAAIGDVRASADSDEDSEAALAHSRATAVRDAARARVDALLAEEREARAERARWEATRDTLAGALCPEDATADLLGRPGVRGALMEHLDVRPGWEDAVAAFLTPFTDAAVVEDLSDAVALLRTAHATDSGRIRMTVAGAADTTPESPRSLPAGAIAAVDLCLAPADLAGPLSHLLRGAVVCESLDEVENLLRIDGVEQVATRAGDLFSRWSATGQGAASASSLSRRASHEDAAGRAERAALREQQAATALVEASTALDRAVKAANDALRHLRDEDATRAKAAQELARVASAAQAAEAETERARQVLDRARTQVTWAQGQVEEAQVRLEASAPETPGEDLAHAQEAARKAAAAARAAREAETRARLSLRATEERSRQVQSRARTLRQNAAREREERQRHARREARRLSELTLSEAVARGARLTLEAAARTLQAATRARDEIAARRASLVRTTSTARARLDDLVEQARLLRDETHRDEIARAELRLRLEQVEQRAIDDIGVEADVLVEEFGPHNLAPSDLLDPDRDPDDPVMVGYSRAHQEKALQRAERELARLGRVNPLALEEHEALSKRHEFLVSQVQDLKKSKADLLHIVEDVDRLVQEAFASAFEDTRTHFAQTFDTLFPGGVGDLVLTDPQDMLTTGIEIEARPAGKKVKRLSLLSGGERSLAALAFLVAIFRARPSPFYVMDEVEAALDDVNLTRLIEVFTQLRRTSQLIIITHQKRTMEVADALYGVTMREGVTRVVSQRLAVDRST
ncbi:chromosome segregation protein SMC [Schaalia sp. 19OD2882]|uniref:chromosome segregation protein SMC n=1 Tax=Schaalia sp. 19OD2882 TaxID=2794089 RepID=UPI001C1F077D|nr:chromosome segregation protein SMC [Schaalia sp. 19OD2882]QWW18832.1 chromosome segregation protein SMC [Schaalia sp. 19OD2882]